MRIYKITGNDCGGFQKPKGHLDTQMFPECKGTETDRNIVQKTIKRRKKHNKKQAATISWPLVTHDAKGVFERWKNKLLSDKEFVKKMDKLSEISGFPGVPDFPLIRDIIESSLQLYRRDGDAQTAAHSIGNALSSWIQKEKEEMVDEEEAIEASNFNLQKYKTGARSRMRDDAGNIIEGPDMNKITPSYIKMIKMYLEEKHPDIAWTLEEVVKWINDNFIGDPAPFDKPKDLYHGE